MGSCGCREMESCEMCQPGSILKSEMCMETFGTKCCVLPKGHRGRHESKSGSGWGPIDPLEPSKKTLQDFCDETRKQIQIETAKKYEDVLRKALFEIVSYAELYNEKGEFGKESGFRTSQAEIVSAIRTINPDFNEKEGATP